MSPPLSASKLNIYSRVLAADPAIIIIKIYKKCLTIQIKISLNKGTDANIIEFLDKAENAQELLKDLIRQRIKE